MDKKAVVPLHNCVLLGHKKEGNLTFYNSKDGPEEFMLSEICQRKTNTMWSHLYVESNEQKNRNREIQNRLTALRGEKGWGTQ